MQYGKFITKNKTHNLFYCCMVYYPETTMYYVVSMKYFPQGNKYLHIFLEHWPLSDPLLFRNHIELLFGNTWLCLLLSTYYSFFHHLFTAIIFCRVFNWQLIVQYRELKPPHKWWLGNALWRTIFSRCKFALLFTISWICCISCLKFIFAKTELFRSIEVLQ